jgi:anti-anti-sigma factor
VIKLWTCPDSSVVCQLSGALDFQAATELRHQIAAIVRPDLELIFDLRRVDYIDAVGASVLVGSVRRVKAMGGRSRVCRINPRIRWVLELIGIDRFLTEPQGFGRPQGGMIWRQPRPGPESPSTTSPAPRLVRLPRLGSR